MKTYPGNLLALTVQDNVSCSSKAFVAAPIEEDMHCWTLVESSPPWLPRWSREGFLDVKVRIWQLLFQFVPVPQRVQGQFSREWDGRPGLKGRLVLPDVHDPGPKLRVKLWSHPHQVLQFLRSLDL